MKRSNGENIDQLFGQLLQLSAEDKYDFEEFRGDWGRSNGEKFNDMLSRFCRQMRELAKSSPVKYMSGSYYVFNGKIYERVDDNVVEQAYQLLVEKLRIGPIMNRTSIRKEVFINTIKNYNVLVPQFDVVAFKNGVVDFGLSNSNPRTMPFSPHYHVTYYHPYDFDPKAKCVRWTHFLEEVLPDKASREILQMFLGLGLVQRGDAYNPYEGKMVNKIELCLMMIGAGANGKSVVFEVMCALFGSEHISKMDYADLTADGDEGMRGRYPIRNAIFNWSSDSDPKKFGKKNTGMFKRIVSGEPVPYRGLGENVMSAGTLPYLIFSLNDLPSSDDVSLGMIRRLQYVNFEVTIPREKQDPLLAAKIIKNELPGVFNWVLEGEKLLRRRQFVFPEAEGSKKHKIMSYLKTCPVMSWLMAYGVRHERCVNGEKPVWMPASTLYESFEQFCCDNNLEANEIPSMNRFSRTLWNDCHFSKKKTPKCMVYETYGVTEEDLKEHFIIAEMKGVEFGEEIGFIKEDRK
jgi:putative DNA primase/helicase